MRWWLEPVSFRSCRRPPCGPPGRARGPARVDHVAGAQLALAGLEGKALRPQGFHPAHLHPQAQFHSVGHRVFHQAHAQGPGIAARGGGGVHGGHDFRRQGGLHLPEARLVLDHLDLAHPVVPPPLGQEMQNPGLFLVKGHQQLANALEGHVQLAAHLAQHLVARHLASVLEGGVGSDQAAVGNGVGALGGPKGDVGLLVQYQDREPVTRQLPRRRRPGYAGPDDDYVVAVWAAGGHGRSLPLGFRCRIAGRCFGRRP